MSREKKRARRLLNLLFSEEFVKSLIERSVYGIEPEWIIKAINENLDPYDLIFNHFSSYLKNPYYRFVVKFAMRKYWKWVEHYLCDVKNLYDLLSKNEEIKKILDTKEGIEWLNRSCVNAYKKLYKWVWLSK